MTVFNQILSPRLPVAVLAAGSLLLLPALPSLADVTIIAQEVASTGQTPPVPQTIHLYYKGANSRLETTGEPVLLQDGKANLIYGLDPARKTCYMTVPTEVEPTDQESPGREGAAKEDVKFDLKETSQTMTFAGTTAHQYLVSGTVSYARPAGGRQGGRRRRGGGGGFPGGGFPLIGPVTVDQSSGGYGNGDDGEGRGRGQNGAFTPAQWSITGEVWLSDVYKFPAKENTLLAAQLAAASAGPFQQPLADALDKHKGLPLLSRITVTHTPASSSGQRVNQYGGVVEAAAPPAATTTATTLTVESISSAPLDDRIFKAPLDYTLVAAPLNPYVPGTPASP